MEFPDPKIYTSVSPDSPMMSICPPHPVLTSFPASRDYIHYFAGDNDTSAIIAAIVHTDYLFLIIDINCLYDKNSQGVSLPLAW